MSKKTEKHTIANKNTKERITTKMTALDKRLQTLDNTHIAYNMELFENGDDSRIILAIYVDYDDQLMEYYDFDGNLLEHYHFSYNEFT